MIDRPGGAMTEARTPAASRSVLAGFGGFIAGVGVAGAAALVIAYLLFFRESTRIDISRPTVVQHIQQLQRLETVVYNMEKIVSGGQDNKYLPRMLAGDRILLIVHGEVIAGVDLGALDPSQLSIDGKSVAIKLPEASLFSTRLDNARTRVYTRETGLFSTPDPELESDVRREAERQLTQAALDGGILKAAATNARTTFTSLLQGLGFDAVTFR
jgi:Protein of unknown function (DUF4230)